MNGVWLWTQRNAPCPLDPKLRDACLNGRKLSKVVYYVSLIFYLTGAFFALLAPRLFADSI
jgi:hypothetical protein